jgi:DNA-binding beta-propeller fold protein YncE
MAAALIAAATGCTAHPAPARSPTPSSPAVKPGLRVVERIRLPGGNSRFDYASLDPGRGLLFVAHLGASQVVEINIRTGRVVRTIDGLPQVHGVLVVPALHRVYATAAGADKVVRINEDTGRILGQTPTGAYPDGLAYDPANHTIWTTNESGGSETIVNAVTGAPQGTVRFGGFVGNVAYDPASGHMLVDVQSHNQLDVIDPNTRAVIRRVPLPGCSDDHGLALDSPARLAFVVCDINSVLLTVDMTTWRVTGSASVGVEPDVVAFDGHAGRVYVASESGLVTIFQWDGHRLRVIDSVYLGDDAHAVAVDPATGRSYFPVLKASGGQPAVLVAELTSTTAGYTARHNGPQQYVTALGCAH